MKGQSWGREGPKRNVQASSPNLATLLHPHPMNINLTAAHNLQQMVTVTRFQHGEKPWATQVYRESFIFCRYLLYVDCLDCYQWRGFTWEGLVPFANGGRFCSKTLNVLQVCLGVEQALDLGRWGHKHGRRGLLERRLPHLTLSWVWWWGLLPWTYHTHLEKTVVHYYSDLWWKNTFFFLSIFLELIKHKAAVPANLSRLEYKRHAEKKLCWEKHWCRGFTLSSVTELSKNSGINRKIELI